MKIWFEALTGKQALLFHSMATYFTKQGHEVLITARNYDYVLSNLERLGSFPFHAIGDYGGETLFGKLVQGTKRILELADLVRKEEPDLLISYSSPDAVRTAFGLGIPVILLNDTPHAFAAAKLTMALSDALIIPSAVNPDRFRVFGAQNIITYAGVDEVLWIKDYRPDKSVLDEIGLSKNNFIVIRCEESKASYFLDMYPEIKPGSSIVPKIISKLEEAGVDMPLVVFPRYPEQLKELSAFENVIIPDKSVDTLSLLYFAKLAMTGGGTMGREGAMLGTPTFYSFPQRLAVSQYITDLGFPLMHTPDHMDIPEHFVKNMNTPHMDESHRKQLLSAMETPLEGVNKAINSLRDEHGF